MDYTNHLEYIVVNTKMYSLIAITTRVLWNYVRSSWFSYFRSEKDTASLSANGKALKIEYVYQGTKQSLWVPFCRQRQFQMYGEYLIAETFDGSQFTIQQQPGVDYLVNADHLGVNSLTLVTEDGETKFQSSIIPNFRTLEQ